MVENEITEIENDESPNRRELKKNANPSHMGFQPENEHERHFAPENGPFDSSLGFN